MVVENAEQLGRRHAALNIENFRPEYWSIFTECIVENVAETNDKEIQIAWRQLVLTLIFYMKMGYERESLRMTRNAQNLMASRNLTPSPLNPNPDIPVL
uniref:Globin family profile domain-containing protein n=1 Tax=Panagrolaimus davidi TaxID=227884 RepID=A0A914QRD9_9BILA